VVTMSALRCSTASAACCSGVSQSMSRAAVVAARLAAVARATSNGARSSQACFVGRNAGGADTRQLSGRRAVVGSTATSAALQRRATRERRLRSCRYAWAEQLPVRFPSPVWASGEALWLPSRTALTRTTVSCTSCCRWTPPTRQTRTLSSPSRPTR
jgi:hypothetical protein